MKRALLTVLVLSSQLLPTGVAQSSSALEQANGLIASGWSALQPEFRDRLSEAVASLEGKKVGLFKVRDATLTSLDLSSPPVIRSLTPGRIHLDAPKDGWLVRIKLRLRMKVWFVEHTETVHATLSNLRLTFVSLQDLTDPLRPTIASVHPQIRYSLSLSSPNSLMNAVVNLFELVLDNSITRAVGRLALKHYLQPMLKDVPGPVPSEGEPYAFFAPPADLEAAALEMRAAAVASHLPRGLVLEVLHKPDGTIDGYARHGDSTIYTGHLLAAMALCHDATGDPVASSTALTILHGIRHSLDVGSSGTYQIGPDIFSGPVLPPEAKGRLVRYAAPVGDPFLGTETIGTHYEAKSLAGHLPMATAIIDGGLWYSHSLPISRDQYVGVMQGLAFAHALIDDPAVKAVAGECISRIIKYLVRSGWVLDQPDGRHATSFLTAYTHVLAFALAGRQADPAAFAPLVAEKGPLAELLWSGAWMDTWEIYDRYYKFNLIHSSLLSAIHLEDNPERLLWEKYALRILQRALGHHQNPYFNAIYGVAQPELTAAMAPKVVEGLKQFLMRPRAPVPVAAPTPGMLAYLATVPTHTVEPQVILSIDFGADESGPGDRTFAARIIPLAYRPVRSYLWSQGPFKWELDAGNPLSHQPGVDYQLGYWLARWGGMAP